LWPRCKERDLSGGLAVPDDDWVDELDLLRWEGAWLGRDADSGGRWDGGEGAAELDDPDGGEL
jgi:hypothetical protein